MSDEIGEAAKTGDERPAARALLAALAYILWYDVGTIEFGIGEPATHPLVWPAIGVGAVVWVAQRSAWVSRAATN